VIRTLVVDDDFRVAEIHAAYVAKVAGYCVVGQVHSAAAAYDGVATGRPDLVLLDLYLPDEHGLALMRRLQDLDPPHPDVMVITAARDVASLRAAMQLGAVHYVVKPFGFNRLAAKLEGYRELYDGLSGLDQASQDEVDKLYGLRRSPGVAKLPKGQSVPTMNRILEVLADAPEDLTASEIAAAVGISRPTAQRYLAQLISTGVVEFDLQYGAAGRPSHRYRRRRQSAPATPWGSA